MSVPDRCVLRWPMAARSARRHGWLPLLLLALGCEPAERLEVEPDCSYRDKYDLQVLFEFEVADAAADESDEGGNFYCFGDEVEDSYPAVAAFPGLRGCPVPQTEPIPDGPSCPVHEDEGVTHEGALVLRFARHDSWGGRFENWNWATSPETANLSRNVWDTEGEVYEGVALVARAAPDSDKFFHLYLEDRSTAPPIDNPATDDVDESELGCIEGDSSLADTTTQAVSAADPNVDTSTSSVYGVVPAANHCYNSFRQLVQLSEQWELHLLPFDEFYQEAQPSRQPGGIDPRQLYKMGFVFSRTVQAEVWIDQVMFYRHKPDRDED